MNILILSDIHANYVALKRLGKAISESDLLLCLGDFVGYYCQVNEVLDVVRNTRCICVRGNHDEYLLSGYPADAPEAVRFGIDYADRVIDPEHRRWLANLPLVWGGRADIRSILLSHGSPFHPLTDYLYPDKIASIALEAFDFDVLAFGQTHRPYLDASRRPSLLNPGSVGQSRLAPGLACAALLDEATMTFQLLEYDYDTREVIDLAKRNSAGDWITKHLE